MSFRQGRHAPAFVLLALSRGPSYGLGILEFLERSLPLPTFDAARVYRTLQALEREGAVEPARGPSGAAGRWYRITAKGRRMLDDFEEDIRKRVANLSFFLEYRRRGAREAGR